MKKFVDGVPYFFKTDFVEGCTNCSSNVELLLWIVQQFALTNIDFLMCNSLTYDHWVEYYKLIELKTGISIGASNDQTGNIKYGGNWLLESTGEEIENIYWNKTIINYSLTLVALTISSSTIINLRQESVTDLIQYDNGSGWTNIGTNQWPVTFNNSGMGVLTVNFTTDITLGISQIAVLASGYFVIGSNKITINDNTHIVTIKDNSNFTGLIRNDSNPGKNDIVVKNIGVLSDNSSLELIAENVAHGWLFQRATSQNSGTMSVSNSYSDGTIRDFCGGLFGSFAGAQSGNVTVTECFSTGSIQNGGVVFLVLIWVQIPEL